MERRRIIYLSSLVVLILVCSSCHPRHVSDIKPNMTKEEVISLWGKTDLITYKTVNGKSLETWEYHFSNTNSICFVTFSQERVAATQCPPLPRGYYGAYPYPLFPHEGGPPEPGTHAPIITHAFAVERGHYGYIWKIYIEADDPDGKMLRIASMVDEVGYGHYPTDWIYLKPQYQKHFKGYIQWNTYSANTSHLPPWTQITLKVSVFDEAGNESNEVVFPFSFEITPNEYAYTLPAPFDQGDLPRLGYVHVDLYYPGEGGPGGAGRISHW